MRPLHVLIAGGGLSGLCLAHGLLKHGHTCTVIERDSAYVKRAGYMLNVNADGGEALRVCLPAHLFALYQQTSHRTPVRRGTIVLDEQLNELSSMPHLGPANDGPLPHTAVDRQTLRQILLTGLDGVLRTGTSVESYRESPDGVQLILSGGETLEGDILVGADGINSAVRRQRLPEVAVIGTGIAGIGVYGRSPLSERLIEELPTVLTQNIAIAADPAGHRLLLGPLRPRRSSADAAAELAPKAELAPLADYTMVSASVDPGTPIPPKSEWTADTPAQLRDGMLTALEGWHPALRGIVERVDLDSLFEISFGRLDPPEPWEPSRVTLIGDAAHAMLPTLGMGANLALRDARLLVEHLIALGDERDHQAVVGAIGASEQQMRDYAYPFMAMTVDHDGQFGGGGLAKIS
jgi:2-polyprenyl-6-methoxyphenol hydroxylase-like FAD-dependent oxidoreductase